MSHRADTLRIEPDATKAGRIVFRLGGTLEDESLEMLLASVEPALANGGEVELELSGLRFLDESGARLLCALRGRGAQLSEARGYAGALLEAVERES